MNIFENKCLRNILDITVITRVFKTTQVREIARSHTYQTTPERKIVTKSSKILTAEFANKGKTKEKKRKEKEKKNPLNSTLKSERRTVSIKHLKAAEQITANRDRWTAQVPALWAVFWHWRMKNAREWAQISTHKHRNTYICFLFLLFLIRSHDKHFFQYVLLYEIQFV